MTSVDYSVEKIETHDVKRHIQFAFLVYYHVRADKVSCNI